MQNLSNRLRFFTNPQLVARVQRNLLTRLLENHHDSLPPEAAALLTGPRLNHEEYCAAWADRFECPGSLPAPLRHALLAIETLALPENRPPARGRPLPFAARIRN